MYFVVDRNIPHENRPTLFHYNMHLKGAEVKWVFQSMDRLIR